MPQSRRFRSPASARVAGLLLAGLLWTGTSAGAERADLSKADRARVRTVTAPARDFSAPERFEVMQAGAGTINNKLLNPDIFSHPAGNLDFEGRQAFLIGNGLFRKDWVSSPSSTQASDGLGPLFNARSCQACHVKDGRGTAPAFSTPERSDTVGLLLRLSIPSSTTTRTGPGVDELASLPDPVYGHQLQTLAVPGLPAEGSIAIRYTPIEVALNGGESVTLMRPAYSVTDLAYGPLHPQTGLSPRMAPPMIGLGLLGAIHEDDILANVAANRGDGVSGRANWVKDLKTGRQVLGRFNWKAGQPTVMQQSAVAFSHDMGLSTPLVPDHYGDCTQAQADCRAMPHGAQAHLGEHEVPGDLLDFVDIYSSNLGVPQRRDADDARVLAGKKLFYESNCVACHVPKYVTRRDAERPEHRFQLIWPYTDLLLHDMGEGLADHQGEGAADGREWRTPPLWGIGLTRMVNPAAGWLHDGRARTLLEAVLWHGGEAQAARDRVVKMTPDERADLIRFLESL
ncbi:Probable thiol oxidoreductase with 2 cytochrome c heme-binding sites [plant metagenome]